MNPNPHDFWFNNMQNFGNSPPIPNQQNAPSFENASNIPNLNYNPNFQNSIFTSNPQNNQHFGNYPYHTPPYPYQHFSSQSNSSNMSHGVQMGSSGVQLNNQELETPQVDTQGGLETINLNEEVGTTSVVKTSKVRFQPKEDELLIQSWLNISKDPIVGVDQRGDSFWKRIGEAYNNHRDKNSQERNPTSLKSRWHKQINPSILKFVGCYKDVVALKKSGTSESDIISAAKDIYYQDKHENFTFENAWRLLKDEPKWRAGSSEPSEKRTKNSASGAYSASSNPPTPTSEYNPQLRPLGQKAAKRKEKEKFVEKSTPKFDALKNDLNKRIEIMSGFARDYARFESEKVEIERKRVDAELQKAENDRERMKINDLEILSKDTSNMNPRQLKDYEYLCGVIRSKYGLE